jgi:hypothetical protein
VALTRDEELWGIALWVEKHHGDRGNDFIAERISDLENSGEHGGVQLWRQIAERFSQLGDRGNLKQ